VIAIIDYGAGNLQSACNAFTRIGASVRVARTPDDLAGATRLILPGVGHFGQMMRALDDLGLRAPLLSRITGGIPFLGICLGMQALYDGSDEAPEEAGLGLLPGRIARFDPAVRVPHMGWNTVERVRASRLFPGPDRACHYYFANSYYAPIGPDTSATCTYGARFTAVIERANVFGVQFHPEKSGTAGLRLLQEFLAVRPC